MSRHCYDMFVALRLVASIVSICLVGTATPEVARRASDGKPLWVAATAAFQEDGQLRRELFSDYARERFDRVRARNIDDCTVFTGGGPLEIFEPMDSFEALVAHAKAIVAGEVIGAEQGFYAENAGTLYTIETSRTWKLNGLENGAHAFLFVGSARIETPRGWICAKPPSDAPVLAVGDHLLFLRIPPRWRATSPSFKLIRENNSQSNRK